MYKTNIDGRFFEKYKDQNVVINCPKQEHMELFYHLMITENVLTEDDLFGSFHHSCMMRYWESYKEYTCYDFNNHMGMNFKTAQDLGYKILYIEDYINQESVNIHSNLFVEAINQDFGINLYRTIERETFFDNFEVRLLVFQRHSHYRYEVYWRDYLHSIRTSPLKSYEIKFALEGVDGRGCMVGWELERK